LCTRFFDFLVLYPSEI